MSSSSGISTKLTLPRHAELTSWRASVVAQAFEAMQQRVPDKILALNARLARITASTSSSAAAAEEERFGDAQLKCMASAIDSKVYPPAAARDAEQGGQAKKKRKVGAADGAAAEEDGAEHEEGVLEGRVVPNAWFTEALEELRSEWTDLIEIMDHIKLFISLNIPMTEEGDNGGVATQEEALTEVARSQETGYNWLSTPCSYHSGRGECIAKMLRYPGVEDFRLALHEYDRRGALRLRAQYTDLRNTYAVVLDILEKNMKRIAQPKSGNGMNNYG